MHRVSFADPDLVLEFDPADPPGFRAAMARVGPQLGATQTGMSLYEIPPGEAICPYHYEHAEEEWLLVLSGRPSVRTPEGVSELAPLDALFFPRGPDGAHQVRNDSGEPARVVMWSTVVVPAVSVYPDSDKIGVWTAGKVDNALFERGSAVDYFKGEG